jgi:hypothetical protein
LLTFFFTNYSFAQEGETTTTDQNKFYLTISSGYNFSNGANDLGADIYYNNEPVIMKSLGEGINFNAGFGYMFNNYLGVELGLSYLHRSETSSEVSNQFRGYKHSLSSSMFRITPSVIIRSGMEKITPYAKFGVLFGIGDIYKGYEYTSSYDNFSSKQKLNGGMAFGYHAAIGSTFSLNEKLALFAEFNLVGMSYSPTKGEFTEYNSNGHDLLNTFSIYHRETEFVDEITNNTITVDTKPSQELKTYYAFGSIGLNIGLHFSF